jgi:hypothetical protein
VTWLTWRQHRSEALVLGCIVLAAVAGLLLLELAMSNAIVQLGLGTCAGPACADAESYIKGQFGAVIHFGTVLLTLVPGLVGMFLGAPMVAREVDRRTHWLVWSQDVGRGRWLLVKSAGVLLLGVVAVGVFTAALTWTLGTFFRIADTRFDPFFFDVQGAVPVAAAVFALALGIAVGAVVPRPLPAMLIVLIGFAVVRFEVAQARFHYPPAPLHVSAPSPAYPRIPAGGWRIGAPVLIDAQGNRVLRGGFCPDPPGCAGYRFLAAYQPVDRFWRFQAIESGIYLVLSLPLFASTAFWVRRRIA